MEWYFVGADFGQSRDYTAIAVIERAELVGKFDWAVRAHEKTVALRLRYLERIPSTSKL
jgi:phage terminase large subunit-like protein